MEEVENYIETKRAVLKTIINAISNSTTKFVVEEFDKILTKENVKAHAKDIMPYLYASAFLSFSGREITEENLSNIFKAINLKYSSGYEKLLIKANVRSHLVYIYAYYFLIAMGRLDSEEEMLNLVEALGMKPDKARIKEVLSFLSSEQ